MDKELKKELLEKLSSLPKSVPSWSLALLAGAAAGVAGERIVYAVNKHKSDKAAKAAAAAIPVDIIEEDTVSPNTAIPTDPEQSFSYTILADQPLAAQTTGGADEFSGSLGDTIIPGQSFVPEAPVTSAQEEAAVEEEFEPITIEEALSGAQSFIEQNCPYLEMVGTGARYYITQSVNIGRFEHNDIHLTGVDKGVSRLHCRIFIRDGNYYVIDLGAKMKATVDGRPVDNFTPTSAEEFYNYQLKDGSVLTVGTYEFLFSMNQPEGEEEDDIPLEGYGTSTTLG